MALQRNNGTSSLLNAARNADNAELAIDRRMNVKTMVAGGPQRAALGNISNRSTALSQAETLKIVIKEEVVTPCVVDEVTSVPAMPVTGMNDVLLPQCEAPMDMSTNSQGEEAFSKQMLKLNIVDIDQDDGDNPQLLSEYVNDIYTYMHELERAYPIRPQCLSAQKDINGRMRGILIDWMVQVHLRFHLLQETLFLSVAILDRYLQLENVSKSKLQLVGVTSMWIAAKYEEMYAPEVADFVYITDNAYCKAEIRGMECAILKALDFQLGRPLSIHFLRRNSKAGEVDATTHTMAKYLMELTIVEYDLAHYNPSEIAAAALCLSIKLLANAPWSATLVFYSKYTEAQLQPLLVRMAQLVRSAGTGKLVAIKTKYQSSKFMRISKAEELSCALIDMLADGSESV